MRDDKNMSREDLIKAMYSHFHEAEEILPDEVSRDYIFDSGTGTLYCMSKKEKQYERDHIEAAEAYFREAALILKQSLANAGSPQEVKKKIEYCEIAANAINVMLGGKVKQHLEHKE